MGSLLNYIAQGTNPWEGEQEAAAAKNAQAEAAMAPQRQALLQQEVQKGQLANQLAQQNLRDMAVIRSSLARNGGDFDKALSDPDVLQNVNPNTVLGIQKVHADTSKLAADAKDALARAGESNAKTQDAENAYLGGLARRIRQNGYDPAVTDAALLHAEQVGGPIYSKAIEQLRQQIKQNPEGIKGIIDQVYESTGTGEKDRAAASKQADEAAAAAKNKADAEHQQMINDAMRGATTAIMSGQHPIDAMLGKLDPETAAALKIAYDQARQSDLAAGDMKMTNANAVLEKAAARVAELSAATRQNKVNTAVAVKRGTLPLEVAQAVQTEIQKAHLAGGIGQIIDPMQRNEASRALDAADKEALDKIAAADSLKNTVNMSLAGNKVAPNLETIEELRSIVNRVNGAELRSVGSSGDAYDRVKGFLGKWTAGQPIPDNIQKDFLAVAEGQQQVAQAKHQAAYGTVAARFGVKNLQAPDIAGIYSQARGNAPGAIGNPAGRRTVDSKAEYDALPPGTEFIDSRDGKPYRKP